MINKKTFSFSTKFLALLLSILTVLLSLPLSAFAANDANYYSDDTSVAINEETNKDTNTNTDTDTDASSASPTFTELTSERSLYSKTIRSSDGKITVAEYGMPVHIQNADGTFENIDNGLIDKGDSYLTGNTGICLCKELSSESFAFSLDNGKISVFMPLDETIKYAKGVISVSEKDTEERTAFEKLTVLDNLSSEVTYYNVFPSADLRYTVTPNGVKEEIILHEKSDAYDYSFVIRADGLSFKTDDSGNILAVNPDNGETEYILPAPFACDSAENRTDEKLCYYTLTENEDNSYTVSVTVDDDWMNSPDRVYPVTIDPTVYYGGYRSGNMRDSIISQNYPSSNYGSAAYLKAGYDSANANTIIYIAPWSLQSIPAGAYITGAQLNLTANGTNVLSSDKLILVAKKIIRNGYTSIWGESSVCWNTGCTYGDILDYNELESLTAGTVVSWNITSAVREWYNDSSTFQGIAVMQYDTSSTASNTVQFHASESTSIGTGYTPFFTYSYVSTLGVEDYYSYFSSDAGLAGESYVNAATGALTLSKSLLSTTDSLFPYTVSFVYNSKLAGRTYTYSNAQTAYGTNISPYGFKLNIQETIIEKAYKGSTYNNVNYYIWSDSDGTEHWFAPKDGSTTEYGDEDGLQLTLTTVSSHLITIKDDSGTVKYFSRMSSDPGSDVLESWYLSSISDGYGNTVSFTSDSCYRPQSVSLTPASDGTITFLNIEYDSASGLPYAIRNEASEEAIIFRYSGTYNGSLSTANPKYLRQLVYVKGSTGTTVTSSACYGYYCNGSSAGLTEQATVYYTYDSCGRLKSTVNASEGTGTYYVYDSLGNVTAVYPAESDSSGNAVPSSSYAQVHYSYDSQNNPESIATASVEYILSYDDFGNKENIYAGDYLLAEYEYNPYNGKLTKISYGSTGNIYVRYIYDSLENISEILYNNGDGEETAYRYTYTSYGRLSRTDDLLRRKSTSYKYSPDGRLTAVSEYDTDSALNGFGISLSYNDEGKNDWIWYSIEYACAGETADYGWNYNISYNKDGSIKAYNAGAGVSELNISSYYDSFDRTENKIYDYGNFTGTVEYTYCTCSGSSACTTAQINTVSSAINGGVSAVSTYTYDGNGNITKILQSDGNEYRYVYDKLGQLIREDNTVLNKTFIYSYDNAGNILSKKIYSLTAEGVEPSGTAVTGTYGYTDESWGDLLTSYNGTEITYDGIGNPLAYYNGSDYTFTWKNGRQLATAEINEGFISFEYNEDGIRVSKTVDGSIHSYRLNGSQIEAEEYGNQLFIYIYDADGSPVGMQYRTSSMAEDTFYTFWYEKNLQGDITAVYNDSGVKVVSYTYDAWGNFTVSRNNSQGSNRYAIFNPFRYRGYYYDTETGLYYLNSRYYSPVIGRFISADSIENLGSTNALTDKNLYAYCDNNPIMRIDKDGKFWNILIGIGGGAIVGAASSIITQALDGSLDFSSGETWAKIGVSALSGAITGGCAASGLPLGGQIVVNGICGMLSSTANTVIDNNDKRATPSDFLLSAGEGLVFGTVAGYLGGSGTATNHLTSAFSRALSNGNWSYYFTQIGKEAVRAGKNAIPGIVRGTIPYLVKAIFQFDKRMVEAYGQ